VQVNNNAYDRRIIFLMLDIFALLGGDPRSIRRSDQVAAMESKNQAL